MSFARVTDGGGTIVCSRAWVRECGLREQPSREGWAREICRESECFRANTSNWCCYDAAVGGAVSMAILQQYNVACTLLDCSFGIPSKTRWAHLTTRLFACFVNKAVEAKKCFAGQTNESTSSEQAVTASRLLWSVVARLLLHMHHSDLARLKLPQTCSHNLQVPAAFYYVQLPDFFTCDTRRSVARPKGIHRGASAPKAT